MSRNKREGRYAGKLEGRHSRTMKNLKGKCYKFDMAYGMYKLYRLPHCLVAFEVQNLRWFRDAITQQRGL